MFTSDEGLFNEGPAKKDGWSASGSLFSGVSTTEVSMAANFPEPGNYTVQFSAIFPPSTAILDILQAEAEIQWSVEGNTVIRKVTVGNGVSITGSGQAVRVIIRDVSNVFGLPGIEYLVAMTVSKGVRVSKEPPVLCAPFSAGRNSVLAPGGSYSVTVPPNAGVNFVQVSVSTIDQSPLLDCQVLVKHVAPGGLGNQKVYDPRVSDWVSLAPSATTITVTNKAAAPAVFCYVIFGVDG